MTSTKVVFVVCLQVLSLQNVFSHFIGRPGAGPLGPGPLAPNLAGEPCGFGPIGPLGPGPLEYPGPLAANEAFGVGLAAEIGVPGFGLTGFAPGALSASNGGAFIVSSSSPVSPTGVSVLADNLVLDGALAVTGNMPFLGAVSLEGTVPAAGESAVLYGSGDGNVGILAEGPGIGPNFGPGGPGPLPPYPGYNPAAPGYGPGLGYGRF